MIPPDSLSSAFMRRANRAKAASEKSCHAPSQISRSKATPKVWLWVKCAFLPRCYSYQISFFTKCPTCALFSSDRISFICLHQEQMSTSSCYFPSLLMGGSAGAKAAATRKGKITMATQVICILHVFPSPHPTADLSHPDLKPIEPVTSWQDGDCSSVSCTQSVLLCFGAHHCGLKSSKRDRNPRERQLEKHRALHYCRWGAGYAAFVPELQIH